MARRTWLTSAALGGMLLGLAAAARGQGWWSTDWPYRRAIEAKGQKTHLPGDEVAAISLPTHGEVSCKQPRFTVRTVSGKECPAMLLSCGPGDRLSLCFALQGNQRNYLVYYGNRKAPAFQSDWRPRRGVLLESWAYRGGSVANFQQTLKTFEQAGPLQGRLFVPNIFLGHNPLGPTANTCHKYTGWLMVPADGTYTFTTSSNDASFLLIDDTPSPVVSWAGVHGWRRDARHAGTVDLTRGVHKLTYYHVNVGARGGAVAGWKRPGRKRFEPIPATFFAPVSRGAAGPLERYARAWSADFDWSNDGETFFDNRYTFRYRFSAARPKVPGAASFQWEFGDGTTADQPVVDHIYLTGGMRTVALTVTVAGKTQTIANRVHVTRDWRRVTDPKLDPVAQHAKIVADYPFAAMKPDDLAIAIELLGRANKHPQQVAAALAAVDQASLARPNVIESITTDVARLLVDELQRPDDAVALCARLEQKATDFGLKALGATTAGRIAMDELNDPAAAAAAYRRALDRYADRTRHWAVRGARIGMGDVFRRQGDGDRAREYYQAGGIEGEPDKQALQVGSLSRSAEDYIRRREYEAAERCLGSWEWKYPLERLVGHSTLLRVQLELARDRPDRALRAAEELLGANPSSTYAPQLLMQVADIHRKADRPQAARDALQRLIDDYPASELVAEARKRLAG